MILAAALGSLARPPRLRAAELKARLRRFGVAGADNCFEKEELLELLRNSVPEAATTAGHPIPLEQCTAAQGGMGAGVSVTDKSYFGLRLELSKSSDADRVLWVLDSAASHSLVTPGAASKLGAQSTGVTATASSATSVDGGFKQVDLGSAALAGGLALGTIKPVVMDLPISAPRAGDAVGLLGLDVLSRCDVELFLRPDRPLAVVYEAGAAAAGAIDLDGMARLQCRRLPSGLLATTAQVTGGRPQTSPVDAIIDLGSSTTVCNYAVLDAAGIPRDADRVQQTDTVIAGQTGEPIRVAEAPLDLYLGDGGAARRTAPDVSIADLPIFATLGVRGPAMVLGLDCLAAPKAGANYGARVVLSARDGLVWLEALTFS